ncbi:MAG: hypothetical protein FJ280_07545 [Planctomycetes bacterium]|nr:hypothetical protein [Planctomycetota bacterium]
MVKAIREAQTHSNWVQHNEPYEAACREFVDKILTRSPENDFWSDFLPFQNEVSAYGVYNSLSQTMLKIACAGLPDFYQGSELWDLNPVDPDNRRPVDFAQRQRMLKEITSRSAVHSIHRFFPSGRNGGHSPPYALRDASVKLFLIYRGLRARRANRSLFDTGDYRPASVAGSRAEHLVAFSRIAGPARALVVVPRFLTSLVRPGEPPLGPRVWEDTSIALPAHTPSVWHNPITDETVRIQGQIPVAGILRRFPAALPLG